MNIFRRVNNLWLLSGITLDQEVKEKTLADVVKNIISPNTHAKIVEIPEEIDFS